jgi:hypothetical protein
MPEEEFVTHSSRFSYRGSPEWIYLIQYNPFRTSGSGS